MTGPTSRPAMRFACGLSVRNAAEDAAIECAEQVRAALDTNAQADVVFMYLGAPFVEDAAHVAAAVHARLQPRCLIGVSSAGIIGARTEVESGPALSLVAGLMPGVEIVPFSLLELPELDDEPYDVEVIAKTCGFSGDHRGTILLADPFSSPLEDLIPAMSDARAGRGPIVGCVASAGTEPGSNALILNDRVFDGGLVGVSFRGPVRVDALVSQGCRPFGPNLVVTRAGGNTIKELGGRKAMEAIREAIDTLTEDERKLLSNGIFVGRVSDEYKDHPGRGDYVVSNIVGADEAKGEIAVGGHIPPGRTVRLHLRDPGTAGEDLSMLLDAQKLHDLPAGALLFECTSRGSQFFGDASHDAGLIARSFSRDPEGAERAKAGELIESGANAPVPLGGCFGVGEIGPIGDEIYLQGHTACMALFRAASEAHQPDRS